MDKKSNAYTSKTKSSPRTKIIIQTQFNPDYKPQKGEPKSNKPSQTSPDMALSVQQLMKNHARGIPNSIQENTGQYFETEIPVFDDITEETAYKENLAHNIKETNIKAAEEIKASKATKKETQAKAKTQAIKDAKALLKDEPKDVQPS